MAHRTMRSNAAWNKLMILFQTLFVKIIRMIYNKKDGTGVIQYPSFLQLLCY